MYLVLGLVSGGKYLSFTWFQKQSQYNDPGLYNKLDFNGFKELAAILYKEKEKIFK